MLFSYEWLQSFFQKRLPKPKKLAELLTMHTLESEAFGKKSPVLEIDVLPNRMPDCCSHIGIAREIKAILGIEMKSPLKKLRKKVSLRKEKEFKIEIKDENDCPRYSLFVIEGVEVRQSPLFIRKRLKECGISPINNIVDITNYVMLETGQPLHAFDGEKIEGKKIIVRRAKKEEKIKTIDGKEYNLDKDVLVIADSKKPIAIAGIKGGEETQITKKTKIVALEGANFAQRLIRQGSKKLNLQTDASLRFEHGLDPNLVSEALWRAGRLIEKIAGGKIREIHDFYPKKIYPKKIKLDLERVKEVLGKEIEEKKIFEIFKRLEFKAKRKGKKEVIVEVPTFRQDISLPEDLIEEIGRIYGYQNIPSKVPFFPAKGGEVNEELEWERKIKEIFKNLGFFELYSYSFIGEKEKEIYSKEKGKEIVELENPISSRVKYLRPTLLFGIFSAIEKNQKKFKEIRVFEIGKVFYYPSKEAKKITEKKILAGAITGKNKFFELKGVIENLLESLGIADKFFDSFLPTPDESPSLFWQKGISAEIKIGEEEIGFLGKIERDILELYEIEDEVFAFEIDFEKLLKIAQKEHEYRPPSPYPEVIRDLAVLVPLETLAGEVMAKIHIFGGELVRDVEIFDIYEGEPLPEGKKNLAFHIIFQSDKKTLTSKEVDNLMAKIIKGIEENPDWEVRK